MNSLIGKEISSSLDIPIIELPILLEPINDFLDKNTKTKTEHAARRVYFVHYRDFVRTLTNDDSLVISLTINVN